MRVHLLTIIFICFSAVVPLVAGENDLFETNLSFNPSTGVLSLEHPNSPEAFYLLLSGTNPGTINAPLWIELGNPDNTFNTLEITPELGIPRFYTIVQRPNTSMSDLDEDGMSDFFELNNRHFLNPLDAQDAFDNAEGTYFISDRQVFEFLSQREDFPGALDVREVKFLITGVDGDDPRLYLMNTENFPYHYNFAVQSLGWTMSQGSFNSETYFTTAGRKNLAGSLVAHDHFENSNGSIGMYTMEFWPTDPVAFQHIQLAYNMMLAAMPFMKERLAYHPPSETQRALYQQERSLFEASDIQVIQTETLFGNLSYAAMNQGETLGRLKLANGSSATSIRDIVIYETLPNDLSHVSGIITEVPQTPLSHVNLKAKQNNTPNAYIKNASTHPDLLPYLNQYVHLSIRSDGFDISSATQMEVDEFLENLRPPNPQFPLRNLLEKDIKSLSDIVFADSDSFGAKAANVAELGNIFQNGTAPEGFAVPFYYYDEFMKSNGFYTDAQTMISAPEFLTDPDARKSSLSEFRDKIRDTGVLPEWMRDDLNTMHKSFPTGTTLRCRSSTNNEDLPEFNGAGLYNSYTHHLDEGHIEKSIKQVWASLWTFRAFEERDFHRIDHMTTAMGVLVHPNYKDELANGVGVTQNIFAPSWRGYYVNVQVGEDLVTNPDNESIPEEFLVADLAGEELYEIQYIRFSNRTIPGEKILTKAQVLNLASAMLRIQDHFRIKYGYASNDPSFAMEIEFKITAENKLAIKQARPWTN